ncbi:hypothetical protein ACFVRU_39485, partial [Streptomyces sp. NPDC057927]
MAMPLRQSMKVAAYLFEQKLRKRDKFALLVELEPPFACNLKCEGCGKIQRTRRPRSPRLRHRRHDHRRRHAAG